MKSQCVAIVNRRIRRVHYAYIVRPIIIRPHEKHIVMCGSTRMEGKCVRCFIDVDVGEDAQIMIGRCGTRDHGNAHVTLHFPIGKVRRKTHNQGCGNHLP